MIMGTIREYLDAAETVMGQVVQRAKSVVGCFVYGSVVKGEIRPNKSDIVDGLVVFDDSMMESEEQFTRAIEAMTGACRTLQRYPCPTHPFQYYTYSEAMTFYPSALLTIWSSDRYSRCIHGTDVRRQIGSSASSRKVSQLLCLSFFRSLQGLARFLGTAEYTAAEESFLLSQLRRYRKVVPLLACVGHGNWVEHSEADSRLQKLMPEIDLSILHKFDRAFETEKKLSAEELSRIAKELITLFFLIYEKTAAHIMNAGAPGCGDERSSG